MIVAPRSLRLHHPAEADRMALRHVRALNDDAVGVLQILLERGGAASSERCPQTGDRGGVSNTGLIFDLDDAERGEELLDEVVLFVVERGAAQVRDAHGAPQRVPVLVAVFPVRLAGASSRARRPCPSPVRAESVSHVGSVRPAIQHMLHAVRARHQLERRGALRAQAPVRDRRARDRLRCR